MTLRELGPWPRTGFRLEPVRSLNSFVAAGLQPREKGAIGTL
ncbi:hypothetical protein SAMN02745206_03184 [Desulfacinum infernum DSM 9756]|uniref:Uncharacterized protein n=1 Tax=Desulfacinum infernum DSM 9756 TaxID=1121391 RepID=A0A1M5GQ76_9BACT|nr:hypothetical protein SAMN02745206_03184 [Desulfacinum infernum DSM 9756]